MQGHGDHFHNLINYIINFRLLVESEIALFLNEVWGRVHSIKNCQGIPTDRLTFQAISGENFSQSEYVAVGAIFQFAFLPLTRGDPSCVPLCKFFEHVWQTSVPFHKSLECQFLYSHSVSSNPHALSAEAHNK